MLPNYAIRLMSNAAEKLQKPRQSEKSVVKNAKEIKEEIITGGSLNIVMLDNLQTHYRSQA